MTITRVGTTQKYAAGWEQAFGKVKKSKPAAAKDSNAQSKKGAAKAAAKKAKAAPKAAVKKAKVAKAAPKATKKK